MTRVSRALISVSDKSGVVDFARELSALGVEILSTGGTAAALREQGVAVREVSQYTGFPEIMDGRLKTLHPRIHGGLLGRRPTDEAAMRAHGIEPIDLLVVNLYPFERTVSRPGCGLEEAIENIDIGGPAMLRAAAKNHARVTVVTDAADYPRVIESLRRNDGAIGAPMRAELAAKAFACTARYDAAIANYLECIEPDGRREFPRTLSLQFTAGRPMRYGENPHQRAALYRDHGAATGALAAARQRQGQELSYNNVADADAALGCARAFAQPVCVIVKHANPCGVAVAESPLEAYLRALRTDPTSAFGGIIAFNRPLDEKTAATIVEHQFVEVLIAPEVTPAAMAVLGKRPKLRVLECAVETGAGGQELEYKRVDGGLLVQSRDDARVSAADLRVVSRRAPAPGQLEDLLFAWRVVKYVKSNAIVFCRDGATLGIGAGQMSRVYSARIAALKAADEGLDLAGSVLASDAFFPFRDAVDQAAEAGAAAIIQPGGSIRDEEVIAAADEHGLAMVFTGVRHFRH